MTGLSCHSHAQTGKSLLCLRFLSWQSSRQVFKAKHFKNQRNCGQIRIGTHVNSTEVEGTDTQTSV